MAWRWALAASGVAAAIIATASDHSAASATAGQTWPAFVLVAGLLLVGVVAAEDGLFIAAGDGLDRVLRRGWGLFLAAAALIMTVTALLNLDTSVAFLTPVMVRTASRRPGRRDALLPACVLLSNAGSLLLPGSNLTNLIVFGNHPESGSTFFIRMFGPWLVAGAVTAVLIVAVNGFTGDSVPDHEPVRRPVIGIGALAVTGALVAVLVTRSPAPWVAAIGVAAVSTASIRSPVALTEAVRAVDSRVLIGLFGLAVGLGVIGRDWTAPARLLGHLDPWATAAVGAGASVAVNNLPAAALLSARPPAHPLALLVGLDVGPNLFVTGSLAWVLWYSAASRSGGTPDIRRTVLIGALSAPVAISAAVAVLLLTSTN